MLRFLKFWILQYIPFLLTIPILILVGPFTLAGRDAMRGALARFWFWRLSDWAMPDPLATRVADPSSFTGGPLGKILEIEGGDGSLDPYELQVLGGLVRSLPQGARVFEIGTFKGRTAINLSHNLPEGGSLQSLDIGQRLDQDMLGRHPAERARIRFVQGDSTKFDAEGYLREVGNAHLVFVDGAHELPFVLADTRTAWKMLAEGGILAWHDYGTYGDVRRGVHQVMGELGRDDVVWFSGTTIAAVRK